MSWNERRFLKELKIWLSYIKYTTISTLMDKAFLVSVVKTFPAFNCLWVSHCWHRIRFQSSMPGWLSRQKWLWKSDWGSFWFSFSVFILIIIQSISEVTFGLSNETSPHRLHFKRYSTSTRSHLNKLLWKFLCEFLL